MNKKNHESEFSLWARYFPTAPLDPFPLFSALWIGDTGAWSPHTKSPGPSFFLASCWVGQGRHWLDPRPGEGKAGLFPLVSALRFCTPWYPHILSAALFSGSSSKSASETQFFSLVLLWDGSWQEWVIVSHCGWSLVPQHLLAGPTSPPTLPGNHLDEHAIYFTLETWLIYSVICFLDHSHLFFSPFYIPRSVYSGNVTYTFFFCSQVSFCFWGFWLFDSSLSLNKSLKFFPHSHQLTRELTLIVFTEVSLTTVLSFFQPFMQEIFFKNFDTEHKMVCERQTRSLCMHRRYNFEEKKTIPEK